MNIWVLREVLGPQMPGKAVGPCRTDGILSGLIESSSGGAIPDALGSYREGLLQPFLRTSGGTRVHDQTFARCGLCL